MVALAQAHFYVFALVGSERPCAVGFEKNGMFGSSYETLNTRVVGVLTTQTIQELVDPVPNVLDGGSCFVAVGKNHHAHNENAHRQNSGDDYLVGACQGWERHLFNIG